MTVSPSPRRMPRTPVESRPANTRTSSTAKRMARPARRGQQHVLVGACRRPRRRCASPSSSFMAILPARLIVDEVATACCGGHCPIAVANITSRRSQLASSSGSGRIEVMLSPCSIGSRFTKALPRAFGVAQRQAPDLELVDLAARRRRTAPARGSRPRTRRMTASSSLVRMPERPLPPCFCGPIGGQRRALDVAAVGDGDDHLLARRSGPRPRGRRRRRRSGCGAARRRRRAPRPVPRARRRCTLLARAQDLQIAGDAPRPGCGPRRRSRRGPGRSGATGSGPGWPGPARPISRTLSPLDAPPCAGPGSGRPGAACRPAASRVRRQALARLGRIARTSG